MDFGQIIKKAWKIAWTYRFLWVLGIFAGVTGAGGGGGSYSGGNSFNSGSGSGGGSNPFNPSSLSDLPASTFESALRHWLPVVVAIGLLWVIIGIGFLVLSVAARGGLIWAVNELEESRRPLLRDAWKQGFTHFWRLFALGILLGLPMLIVIVVLVVVIVVPIVMAIASGGKGAALAVVPVCGSLIIAVPLLFVLSFVLGIMNVVGQRRIVLDGEGAWQSAKDGWRTLRSRFKDTGLMWLINWGLNIAAGLVLAIPIVIVTVVLLVPAIFAGIGGQWGILAAVGFFYLIIVFALSFFFTGVWGTFTSALWTILYRRMTGRELAAPSASPTPTPYPAGPVVAPAYPGGPAAPTAYPAPPAPPAPSSGFTPPPPQGWAPPPSDPSGWSPGSAAPQRGLAHDPYHAMPDRNEAHDPYGGSGQVTHEPTDPYLGDPEPRQPLDPYTPWDASAPVPGQPPHE